MAGRARNLTVRGRGFIADVPLLEPLRRPGELRQPNACVMPPDTSNGPSAGLDKIFKDLNSEPVTETKLAEVAVSLQAACPTSEHAKELVEKVYEYALLNKINAHYGALLCKYIGDFQVGEVKFKFSLFKRLQIDYEDRTRRYSNLDRFLNIVVVLCEIYHHLRLADGAHFVAFVSPIIEYFGMLVDGGSEKEIETFVEQVMKCGKNLQAQNPQAFENLVLKIRQQIIGISLVSSRNMLLHVFEKILCNWNPLSDSATNFYNAVCKQIPSVCE